MPAAERSYCNSQISSVYSQIPGKQDGPIEAAFNKKQRTGNTLCEEATLSEDALESMTNEDLIKTIKVLQIALQASHKQSQVLAETTANSSKPNPAAAAWTPEKINERALKVRELVGKEVKKQMKWQPSCKRGSTKWSYKGMVPNVDVFNKVFEIESGSKAFKLKKVPMREFTKLFGYIYASCRYNDLTITGEHVNLKWDAEESTFQLSGTYGI
ncbi:hypothetical protein PRZ48_001457 [Zasmidium cellare]|uniref:Uncharacterized protein n=1 Tax=Zasmidium cellare TaxID=395010 RepID=A0ABR0F1I5_ZASCE|nr:hypothetical protein PRZ48_001457 [Zasmidium cellare]